MHAVQASMERERERAWGASTSRGRRCYKTPTLALGAQSERHPAFETENASGHLVYTTQQKPAFSNLQSSSRFEQDSAQRVSD